MKNTIFFFVLLFGIHLFADCKSDSINSDPDPSDPNNRKVYCLAGENFSCWDNNSFSTKFAIGERICQIFTGIEGSWYNKVPLLLESDLEILEANNFKFTEKTYESWKLHLNFREDSGAGSPQ